VISLRKGIKPRNPQHIKKNCETCSSNVHTTSDYNDIEWFRKKEVIQAKKVESFKASETESSSALRSKTPTKRYQANPKKFYLIDVKRICMYLKGTPSLGLWYSKCSGGKFMCWSAKKQQSVAMFSAYPEDVAAVGCCANILMYENQLTDYESIGTPLDEPYFKRLIDELEQPFVAAKQVGFNLEDIILNTNNEVALLYPKHNNKDHFKCVSDFISHCCLRKPFTRSPNMYKEYLAEFWYSAKALKHSKVSFSTPTGGIYGKVGVNTFRNAIGAHYLPHSSEYVAPSSIDIVRPWFEIIKYGEAVPSKGTLKKSLLPPRWRLLMAQIIQCLGGKTEGFDQITNKDAIILYSLVNEINIDYANIFWEDIIIKLNKIHREKFVPYTRFLSLLMMHKMKEGYRDGELTPYPTQVFSVNNWALKPNQPEEPPFTDNILAIYVADMPVVFKAPKTSSKA
ncbi:hypothetical protein Tco_1278489, partial [Tanacetum coccineum]